METLAEMKRLVLLLITIPLLANSQLKQKLVTDTYYQNTCVLFITFKSKSGIIKQHGGYGIIINGKYLATVAHLFLPFYDTMYVTKISVRYNYFRNKSDSVDVDLKDKSYHYDFKKALYDTNKNERDFIILKLKHKVKIENNSFNKGSLTMGDWLYSIGFKPNKDTPTIVNPVLDKSYFLFKGIQNLKNNFSFLVCIGTAQQGSSGSPLFNSNGEIVGIIQSGDDKIPIDYINKLVKENIISEWNRNGIIEMYKQGLRISFSLGIDYIQQIYLRNLE